MPRTNISMISNRSQHNGAQTWMISRAARRCAVTWNSSQLLPVRAIAVTAALLCSQAVTGQVQTTVDERREYNVKAVNIYGFCRFVTLPEDAFQGAQEEFVIGIFGNSPIEVPLKAIAAKKAVQNRRLKIVSCRTAADAVSCHLIFVGRDIPFE